MSDPAQRTAFQRFEEAVKKVLAAPKSEIDKKIAERNGSKKAPSEKRAASK